MSFVSPKRKRSEPRSSISPSKVPSLLTRLRPISPEPQNESGGSPRTTVAGKLGELEISQYDLNQHASPDERASKRTHYDHDEIMESSQGSVDIPRESQPQQTDGPAEPQQQRPIHPPMPPNSEVFTFTHPRPPSLPQNHPQPIPRATSGVFSSASSSKSQPPRTTSPPLKNSGGGGSSEGHISDQYWHESEITGHDPNDPDDDGYGINGIGFKPTPGMVQERRVKRARQIEGYRSREAREAREARIRGRRKGLGNGSGSGSGFAAGEVKGSGVSMEGLCESPGKSRVRFREAEAEEGKEVGQGELER